ncbi:GntR family transcriptional regulator [Streptomyces niveus]|uniref:GntR family transcriptional regulator n=1 Tax=Streptomyces niveus TaxID=193462 RepID=UPI0036760FC0
MTHILRTRIANQEWPPGHRFTQTQVAEEFSVKRHQIPNVVAPALRTLREEGILESRPRVGLCVAVEGESWSPATSGLTHGEHIETVLRERLHKRIYKPGERFPSLHALAEEFKVSVATVRTAIQPLTASGILEIRANARYVSLGLPEIPEEALLRQPERRRPGKHKLSAFGETRSLADWAWDPRCVVDRKTLNNRYRMGWGLERALTTPKASNGRNALPQIKSPDPDRRTITGNGSKKIYPAEPTPVGTADTQGIIISAIDISLRVEIPEQYVLKVLRELHRQGILAHHSGIGFSAVNRSRFTQ